METGGFRALGIQGLVNQPEASRCHLPKAVLGPERGQLRQGWAQPPRLSPAARKGKAAGGQTQTNPPPRPQRWRPKCQTWDVSAKGARSARQKGPVSRASTGIQRVGPGDTRGPGRWQARCVRGVYQPEQGPRTGDRRQEAGVGRGQVPSTEVRPASRCLKGVQGRGSASRRRQLCDTNNHLLIC